MKIRPITIFIFIIIISVVALLITVIRNNAKIENMYNNDGTQSASTQTNASSKKVSKTQNEKAKDVYEHIMDEDWDYIWDKMIHYENEVISKEDIKFYFKSAIKTDDALSGKQKMSEQGYELKEVELKDSEENGQMVVGTISNGSNDKVFALYEKGSSKDDYEMELEIDFSSRSFTDESKKLKGVPFIVPSDVDNIQIRDKLIDNKFIDKTYFDSYQKNDDREDAPDYSKYKAYRVILPTKSMSVPENIVNASKDDFGIDMGSPEKLIVTADCRYGTLESPEGVETHLESCYGLRSGLMSYTAKLYLKNEEDKDKILNGLKDILNGILDTYEETKTFQSEDYRKYFVDEFSDEGYKDTIDKLQESLSYKENAMKIYNRRVAGVIADEGKIRYLGNNVFEFIPGTATIWEEEQGFVPGTKTKTCQQMNTREIKVEVQEDGTIKIKELNLNIFSGLFLMRSDFEWNY